MYSLRLLTTTFFSPSAVVMLTAYRSLMDHITTAPSNRRKMPMKRDNSFAFTGIPYKPDIVIKFADPTMVNNTPTVSNRMLGSLTGSTIEKLCLVIPLRLYHFLLT